MNTKIRDSSPLENQSQSGAATDQEENSVLARLFDETADLLEAQGANVFRVAAYRNAAQELRHSKTPVREIFREHGREGLQRIPRIGLSLSRAIATWLETGTLGILLRLRGEDAAEQLLMSVPGLGRELAHRIHHDLHISTLEELEQAAHDGRLSRLPGFGQRRVQAIKDQLDARLRRQTRAQTERPRQPAAQSRPAVEVSELLDVDREYRELASRERLPKLRPRRFNPNRETWLPVLHTVRKDRHYTALFSNTARAHELKRTRDWVVLYLDDDHEELQWTVVTERRGRLAGQRVVRGREDECVVFYKSRTESQ